MRIATTTTRRFATTTSASAWLLSLDIYGMRDEQEKSFMFIKSEQDGRQLRTSKEESANGRLFIQFVALILNCIIYRKFSANKNLQKLVPTRQHMIDELRAIRLIWLPSTEGKDHN